MIEEGEACVGDHSEQEEVEEDQKKFLLCHSDWKFGRGGVHTVGFRSEQSVLLWIEKCIGAL